MNRKTLIFIIITLLIIGVLIFYLGQKYGWFRKGFVEPLARKEPASLWGKMYDKVKNPGAKVPETNPFSAEVNPFKGLKLNPFE